MITQEVLIDVNNHIAPEVVSRLGESNVRQLLIKPVYFNPDGTYTQIVIDSENVQGMFRMVKPDGTFVTTNMALATPSSNPAEFVVTLTGAMSQVAGRGYYDVRIGDTEDASEFIYSAQGLFTIDDDMITNEMIESVAEANGYVFPDDFLTSADLSDYATKEYVDDAIENIDLSDYATKEYVDDAIADIPSPTPEYSTTEHVCGKWINGVDIYEITVDFPNGINPTYGNWYELMRSPVISRLIGYEVIWRNNGNYYQMYNGEFQVAYNQLDNRWYWNTGGLSASMALVSITLRYLK